MQIWHCTISLTKKKRFLFEFTTNPNSFIVSADLNILREFLPTLFTSIHINFGNCESILTKKKKLWLLGNMVKHWYYYWDCQRTLAFKVVCYICKLTLNSILYIYQTWSKSVEIEKNIHISKTLFNMFNGVSTSKSECKRHISYIFMV